MRTIFITRQLADELGIDLKDLEFYYRKTSAGIDGELNIVSEVYTMSETHPKFTWLILKYPGVTVETLGSVR